MYGTFTAHAPVKFKRRREVNRFKSLGTLAYHRESLSALAFASQIDDSSENETIDEDNIVPMSKEEILQRSRWLAAGGKDSRVSIWSLISFERQ